MDIGIYNPQVGIGETGGTETFIRKMLEFLAQDHSIILYTGAGSAVDGLRQLSIDINEIPIQHRNEQSIVKTAASIPPATLESLSMFLNVKRRGIFDQLRRKVDILSTFMYLDNLLVSRFVDIPTVHHVWGVPANSQSLRLMVQWSKPNMVLSNSRHTAELLQKYFGVETDGTVYPGVNIERFHPEADPAFVDDGFSILFVGRFTEGKGVRELIDAFAEIDTEATLYLVGDGELRSDLERRARNHGVADAVEFLGTVPHGEIQHYYTSCDVFCLPSHYESFGLANIEAMACGRPVVTSRLGAIEEYITDGETGLLVPPKDTGALTAALKRALNSPNLRDKLGSKARKRAGDYSWEEQAARMETYLQQATIRD